MKSAVFLLLIAALGSAQAFSLRQLIFGTCVEMCSSDADCLAGHHCLSNGCGHTCQIRPHILPIHPCGLVACDLYCQNGFAVGANGCQICACQQDVLLSPLAS